MKAFQMQYSGREKDVIDDMEAERVEKLAQK